MNVELLINTHTSNVSSSFASTTYISFLLSYCFPCFPTITRYKLSFIVGDGTEEAEMICFGEIGRRIIGKPVETVMRSTKREDLIPLDIASIVSSKFTFCCDNE